MTKYKCGHDYNTIIMNDNILSMSTYFTWKDSVGFGGDCSQCFGCWCEQDRKGMAEVKENGN